MLFRSMQQKIENLMKEGREWIRMKQVYDNARFPDSGTPAYIISSKWLSNYKKYIVYDMLKYNKVPEDIDEAHFEDKHPG